MNMNRLLLLIITIASFDASASIFNNFVEIKNDQTQASMENAQSGIAFEVKNLLPTYKSKEKGEIQATTPKINVKVCSRNKEVPNSTSEEEKFFNFSFENLKKLGLIGDCVDLQGTVAPSGTEYFLLTEDKAKLFEDGLGVFIEDDMQFLGGFYFCDSVVGVFPQDELRERLLKNEKINVAIEVIERGGRLSSTFTCNIIMN